MAGSSIGTLFTVTTFGESHGDALGCIVDGCPSGLILNEEIIQIKIDARKSGSSGLFASLETSRSEADKCKIVSGVFEGKTLGTPICVIVYNNDQKSKDYSIIKDVFRPGHADFTYYKKFTHRDYRGGGRSSGRETIGRIMAGAIASIILSQYNITIETKIVKLAGIDCLNNEGKIDAEKLKIAITLANEIKDGGDSSGGIIECCIKNVKAGLGEPVFQKLDAVLAMAMLSIGAVKGIEFGSGFSLADMKGSETNDPFTITFEGEISESGKNSGGISGGISNGADIVFRLAIKSVPSIAKEQDMPNKDGSMQKINLQGRFDSNLTPRIMSVCEAMAAIVIADFLLQTNARKMPR